MNKTTDPTEQLTQEQEAKLNVGEKGCDIPDGERIANLQSSLSNEVRAHVQVIKQRDAAVAALRHARTYVEYAQRTRGNDDVRADLDTIDAAITAAEKV